MRPLLLLDVDGVLCPLGSRGGEELITVRVGESVVRYSVETPARLQRLAAAFQVVWATSWEDAANDLAPVLGLPPLPYLRFDDEVPLGTSYKLPAIQRHVGQKPMAFVDDDIGNDVHAWAAARAAPTLLVPIPADEGLGEHHVEQLLTFAREQSRQVDAEERDSNSG